MFSLFPKKKCKVHCPHSQKTWSLIASYCLIFGKSLTFSELVFIHLCSKVIGSYFISLNTILCFNILWLWAHTTLCICNKKIKLNFLLEYTDYPETPALLIKGHNQANSAFLFLTIMLLLLNWDFSLFELHVYYTIIFFM